MGQSDNNFQRWPTGAPSITTADGRGGSGVGGAGGESLARAIATHHHHVSEPPTQRGGNEVATSPAGVFGWSWPFHRSVCCSNPPEMWKNRATSCAAESDSRPWGAAFSCTSAFPTARRMRFFLGPDIYRFDGTQKLGSALTARLAGRACSFTLEEIDPDLFGEKLENPPYDRAHRIAAVAITVGGRPMTRTVHDACRSRLDEVCNRA
jgi:hypothetical protein